MSCLPWSQSLHYQDLLPLLRYLGCFNQLLLQVLQHILLERKILQWLTVLPSLKEHWCWQKYRAEYAWKCTQEGLWKMSENIWKDLILINSFLQIFVKERLFKLIKVYKGQICYNCRFLSSMFRWFMLNSHTNQDSNHSPSQSPADSTHQSSRQILVFYFFHFLPPGVFRLEV